MKESIKLLLAPLIIYIWTFVHESIHKKVFNFYGLESNLNWEWINPTVSVPVTATSKQIFIAAALPYVFDIVTILSLYLMINLKISENSLKWIILIPSFDILVNSFLSIDFSIMKMYYQDLVILIVFIGLIPLIRFRKEYYSKILYYLAHVKKFIPCDLKL